MRNKLLYSTIRPMYFVPKIRNVNIVYDYEALGFYLLTERCKKRSTPLFWSIFVNDFNGFDNDTLIGQSEFKFIYICPKFN